MIRQVLAETLLEFAGMTMIGSPVVLCSVAMRMQYTRVKITQEQEQQDVGSERTLKEID